MTKTIDEKTTVPLFAVLGSLVVIAGGIFWLTSISLTSSANTQTLDKVELKQDKYAENMAEIKQDILIIKNDLSYVKRTVERETRRK